MLRRFLQAVTGPRQAGKTNLVEQVLAGLDRSAVSVSADEPALHDAAWLAAQWDHVRLIAKESGKGGAVLALDEGNYLAVTQWENPDYGVNHLFRVVSLEDARYFTSA